MSQAFSGQVFIVQQLWKRKDIRRLAFRALVVICQAVTVQVTFPLWQVHLHPPMLPVLPLPAFDMGLLLLLSLALIFIKPFAGTVLHTLLVFYAILIDQTRLQPEIISLIFLLWGTLPHPNALALARAHLLAMWIWAGINKLLSPGFMHGTAQWILHGLVPRAPEWLSSNFGYVIALTEFGTGFLALFPRTRRLAAVMAFLLHIGIFVDLSPLGHHWNKSVWAWNIALAFAGAALIVPWKESLLQTLRSSRPFMRLAFMFILLAPAGFYVGLMDAYLAHNLYSNNVPRASTNALSTGLTWTAFNVPLPPEQRLYEQYFHLTCQQGDTMTIRDSRWWFRIQGLGVRQFTCSP